MHGILLRLRSAAGGVTQNSCPAGHCHRCGADPGCSRTKTIVRIWTLAGEGEVFGKEVVSKSGKILNDENGQFVAIAITERDLAWLVGTQEG